MKPEKKNRGLLLLPAALIVIICILLLDELKHHAAPVSGEVFCLDTICSISIYDMSSMSEADAKAVIDGAFELCRNYEAMLDMRSPDSEIWKLNHSGGRETPISSVTSDILTLGRKYSEISGGRFDITIGRVSGLWDFHSDKPSLPDKAELDDALRAVDYKQLTVKDGSAGLEIDGAAVDTGAIAKGYIADRLCEYLTSKGVSSALVNLGGNVCAIGGKPSGALPKKGAVAFSIGIEAPYSDRRALTATIPARDKTVVTSGVYERYFEIDGVKYHHVLDPATGYPVETDLISVSVTAPLGHSADCDALSTLCLILGRDEGLKIINERPGFEALFTGVDGELTATDGFYSP